jgi:glutaredoxin-like protein
LLTYLAPEAKASEDVSLFTKPNCPFCEKAKMLLKGAGYEYEEIILGTQATLASLKAVSGHDTVPQVFIGGKRIGGGDDLEAYLQGHS